MDVLEIKNLKITHVDNTAKVEICESFSDIFKSGEIVGVFGPNGSGKSSLLRVLAGLEAPVDGEIIHANEIISYIPQDISNSFFDWANIKRNIQFSSKEDDNKINALWEDFGINFSYNYKPQKCSGGMLQQAAIVRAFINNPKIVIADEPFSALDINIATQIKQVFRKKIKEQGSVAILSLHNIEDFLSLCDRLILITNKPFTSLANKRQHPVFNYNNLPENLDVKDAETSFKNTIDKLLKA